MTYEFFPSPAQATEAYPTLLVNAARCWNDARIACAPVQPRLALFLSQYGGAILAPVLDSLMRCYEVALGRPLAVGADHDLSADETMLVGLITGTAQRRACLHCPEQAGMTLDCALCSARIMLALDQGRAMACAAPEELPSRLH